MARDQSTFTFHDQWLQSIDDLSPDECKTLLLAIRAHRAGQELPDIADRFLRLMVQTIIQNIQADDQRYRAKCHSLSLNRLGKKATPCTADPAPPQPAPVLGCDQPDQPQTASVIGCDQQAPPQPEAAILGRAPDPPDPPIATDQDIADISDLWNQYCGPTFGTLRTVTVKRRKKIETRIREFGKSVDPRAQFSAIFQRIIASDFCRSGAGKWCNFDWVIENDSNYIKVLEGRYDNPTNTTTHNEPITRFDRQQLSEQKLGESIAARCCQKIQREADWYADADQSPDLFTEEFDI